MGYKEVTVFAQLFIVTIVGATIGILVGGVAVYLELKARGVIQQWVYIV